MRLDHPPFLSIAHINSAGQQSIHTVGKQLLMHKLIEIMIRRILILSLQVFRQACMYAFTQTCILCSKLHN